MQSGRDAKVACLSGRPRPRDWCAGDRNLPLHAVNSIKCRRGADTPLRAAEGSIVQTLEDRGLDDEIAGERLDAPTRLRCERALQRVAPFQLPQVEDLRGRRWPRRRGLRAGFGLPPPIASPAPGTVSRVLPPRALVVGSSVCDRKSGGRVPLLQARVPRSGGVGCSTIECEMAPTSVSRNLRQERWTC